MKINILIILFLISSSAFAAGKPYGTAGCGFGSVIMGKNDPQILAATTNNLSTQTFSISSGTSNCVNNDNKTVQIKSFIEANYESLITEMARGNGDTIATLSGLYGCNSQSFTRAIQKNYPHIISASDDATLIMQEINVAIKNSSELKNSCLHVI